MSILGKLTSFVSGSLFREIKDVAMSYWPPEMTPEQKATAALALERAMNEKQLQAMELTNEAEAEFNDRIKEMEGTASDLKALPYIGPLMLFFRGMQRPVWGCAVMYFDWLWFSSVSQYTDGQEKALLLINFIVLSFLFGERAIKNALPIIKSFKKG